MARRTGTVAAAGRREIIELRTCVRCGRATFDPSRRDVSDWPLIEDLDASDHCRSCWMELAGTRGRKLGEPWTNVGISVSNRSATS